MQKEGTLSRIIFYNDGNGYTVAILDTEEGAIRIAGSVGEPREGARYRLEGRFTIHPKYGEQFSFAECEELTSIKIPDNVVAMGDYAFYGCNSLSSVMLSSKLSKIGNSTFSNCESLDNVIIPGSVSSIGSQAFTGCKSLTSLIIKEGVSAIEDNAFSYCENLSTLSIPNSVTSIGRSAFIRCDNLTSISLSNSISTIADFTFSGCGSLKSIAIPNGVKTIGNSAFENCSGMSYVSMPNSVVSIGSHAFGNCGSLSSIIIPNSVLSIGQSAFDGSNKIESITIPVSVTSIGVRAFASNGLKSVKVEWDSPISIPSVFTNSKNATLYVPKGSKSAYQSAVYWKEFKEIVEYEDESVKSYELSITSSGSGSVTYSSSTISGATKSFIIEEGTSVTLTITPNSGYRIGSLIVNNVNVTSSIRNNQYNISNINQNTTVRVAFEAIPPTTYNLSITSSGRGYVTYSGYNINGTTSTYSVEEGISPVLTFTQNSGYRLASVKVNGVDVTSSISNNQYTISNINKNTTVEAVFEAITYSLTIISLGNGIVYCGEEEIYNTANILTYNEGASAKLSFSPANGYRVKLLSVNGTDVTSDIVDNQYTISDINKDTKVNVVFEAIPPTTYSLSISSSGNGVVTYSGYTIKGPILSMWNLLQF